MKFTGHILRRALILVANQRFAEIFLNFKDLNRILNFPIVKVFKFQKQVELSQIQEEATINITISNDREFAKHDITTAEVSDGTIALVDASIEGQVVRQKVFLNCHPEEPK